MNFDARLAKLEQKAQAVLRCAWCRYSLTNVADGGGRRKGKGHSPRDFVWRTCRWCGNRFRQMLPDLSPREREALLLWYHTFDGETYREERAFAAQRWWAFRWMKQALEEEADETEARPAANPAYRGNYGRGKVEKPKEARAVRERRELKERADALRRKAREREARVYGPRTFPLVEMLKELEKDCSHHAHTYDKEDGYQARSPAEVKARELLALARCMEACELVLWGEAEPETARLLATLPAEVERLAEERRAAKREKEERERREREERERERLERLAAAQPQAVAPTPAPDQWVIRPGGQSAGSRVQRAEKLSENTGAYGSAGHSPFSPRDQKPQPPPDDGSDPFYSLKLAHYKMHGVWPPSDWLR